MGRVAADADEDRHAAGDYGDGSIDDRFGLVVVDRRALARRPHREDPVPALVEIVVEEPFVADEVDGSVGERRDDGQPYPRDHARLLFGPRNAKGPRPW